MLTYADVCFTTKSRKKYHDEHAGAAEASLYIHIDALAYRERASLDSSALLLYCFTALLLYCVAALLY